MLNIKNRGQVLVLFAVALIVLFGFAALAIDVAYWYHTRNQLQGAADAAALAGVAKLSETDPFDISKTMVARQEAQNYAAKNKAAGDQVLVSSDGSNSLSSANDITIGFWNMTGYIRGGTPFNAVEVRARRTKASSPLGLSPGGPVGTFFGSMFGLNEVNISARAIAARPPIPSTSLSICIKSCPPEGTTLAPYTTLYFKEMGPNPPPPDQGVAWTEFNSTKSTNFGPDSLIAQYLRGEKFPPDVCCTSVTTNNSAPAQIMDILSDTFDKNKINPSDPSYGTVPYWEVITPVFGNTTGVCGSGAPMGENACPPGAQPDEPFDISRYAVIRVTKVVGNPKPGIHISNYMKCIPCPATELLGKHFRLVK